MSQTRGPHLLEIGDETSGSRHQVSVHGRCQAEALAARHGEAPAKRLLSEIGIETPALAARHGPAPFGDRLSVGLHEQLGRLEARDRVRQLAGGALLKIELAGRQIRHGDPQRVRARDTNDEVVAPRVQEDILDRRAGGDDRDDFAAHQSLCLGGVFDLIAHGDAPPEAHELREVFVDSLRGHACQRHVGAGPVIPAGQRDAQESAALLGILEEHLVEVSDPEEEDRFGVA